MNQFRRHQKVHGQVRFSLLGVARGHSIKLLGINGYETQFASLLAGGMDYFPNRNAVIG
jgi:hypothetical protein